MKGYLHLQNGDTFEGMIENTSTKQEVNGEVVFFTGMTGYQEVVTDPSYKNQIIVFTYPLIGNYGINEHDYESKKPHVSAVVVYECCENGFHYEAMYSFKQYLKKWNIPLITHVDTRAVVKRIRNEGTMPAILSPYEKKQKVTGDETDLIVKQVSTTTMNTYGEGDKHIILLDFGYKKSILQELLNRQCKVTVVPYSTSDVEIHALKPDGIVLSNGPGDPTQLSFQLSSLKKVMATYPTLGICFGHQLIGLAFGGKTNKLPFGHRGANQPVMDLLKKKVYMTSQNHSYVVDEESMKQTPLTVRFKNVNDHSVEGLMHETLPILSVQYHPEAHPGPSESNYIFDEFINFVNQAGREKVYA
ncbi:carbamoyl phosphate synthase small subunit [Metabacillus iocasae]|uniref:Carbamoyl phosphate synthase small chain n=1 Tax=Priestia iocasae TaxID=2291674 RepID=A0ABS2QT32_9BACI|nr:carbamoyl phosphate synthase small subunit [Metabacillus iocasae]MBM7702599.1 carbamoyl-phosphate synthase small subunit [Metabacillus iocasae]